MTRQTTNTCIRKYRKFSNMTRKYWLNYS